MPLKIQRPPSEAFEIIRNAVSTIGRREQFAALSQAEPESLGLALPHRAYYAGLLDVVENSILSAARFYAWRFILMSRDEIIGAAEISVKDDSKTAENEFEFSSLDYGPFVWGSVKSIKAIENTELFTNSDFELRLLKIPSLYTTALWFSGDDNLIVPILPVPRVLSANEVYREEDFTQALRGFALERTSAEN